MFLNIKNEDVDKYIYRITSLKRLMELFKSNKNTLVKPREWNDPYENFILRSKVKQTTGEIVEYNFHDHFYGQCWTQQRASDAMWRIYSPKGSSVRIRTTIRQLLQSLYSSQSNLPEVKCYLGKVLYLSEKKLYEFANNIFDDSGVSVDKLFSSLLAKRLAFKHENEVRLLFFEMDEKSCHKNIFKYELDPHTIISQIMLDPRYSVSEAKKIMTHLRNTTGYEGSIKRSLLYSLPKEIIINANNA
jgi:Protein of unknown function (DUF2971)